MGSKLSDWKIRTDLIFYRLLLTNFSHHQDTVLFFKYCMEFDWTPRNVCIIMGHKPLVLKIRRKSEK